MLVAIITYSVAVLVAAVCLRDMFTGPRVAWRAARNGRRFWAAVVLAAAAVGGGAGACLAGPAYFPRRDRSEAKHAASGQALLTSQRAENRR